MISYQELRPAHWPRLERLFGANGACGGCWCQWWRVPRGGKLWEEIRGAKAKRRFKAQVSEGRALGVLAFEGERPVGWCSLGPRADFPRLETVRAFRSQDTQGVWCVNCFFIPRSHRGKGIARGLLTAALKAMRRRRVERVEAYPVTATRDGKALAAAFAWTGPEKIFLEQGFVEVQRLAPTRPVMRLVLR
jgi:GNAT superfamily N-acetyltransferase